MLFDEDEVVLLQALITDAGDGGESVLEVVAIDVELLFGTVADKTSTCAVGPLVGPTNWHSVFSPLPAGPAGTGAMSGVPASASASVCISREQASGNAAWVAAALLGAALAACDGAKSPVPPEDAAEDEADEEPHPVTSASAPLTITMSDAAPDRRLMIAVLALQTLLPPSGIHRV